MTTEFRDLQELYEKKRKNEQAVSEELLQTRYKKSYDQLCGNVKQKQCELRAKVHGTDESDNRSDVGICLPRF